MPVYLPGRDKPIGYVSGQFFRKTIVGSKHMLRSPKAIAFELCTLDDAEKAGATHVSITDSETGRTYCAPIATVRRYGFPVVRGHGRQVALPLDYYSIDGATPVAEQRGSRYEPGTQRPTAGAVWGCGMTAEFDQVLADLWRGAVWAYWWGTDGPEHTRADGSTYREKDTLWFPVAGRWPTQPAAWAAQRRNVYLCVHGCAVIPTTYANDKPAKRHKVRGRLEHIAAVNCVFAEYDAKDYGSKDAILAHLDTLWFSPSCVVDSGGGFHCDRLLDEGQAVTDANRAELAAMQAAWVELVGGDDGAKDLAEFYGYQVRAT